MEFLIFSDSHGNQTNMIRTIRSHPDVRHVLFLGDGLRDLSCVRPMFPGIFFAAVRGNIDGFGDGEAEDEHIFEMYGCRVLMMHGHTRAVKAGTAAAEQFALRNGCSVLLYGHTHAPASVYRSDGGLYVFNPGSIGRPDYGKKASYGLMDILPNGSVMLSHGEQGI